MPERVLCDDGLRVTIEPNGDRLLLTVTDGTQTSFLTDAATLVDALQGGPLQLSAPEGYCHIEVKGDQAHITLALSASTRKTCSIPAREFAKAVTL